MVIVRSKLLNFYMSFLLEHNPSWFTLTFGTGKWDGLRGIRFAICAVKNLLRLEFENRKFRL